MEFKREKYLNALIKRQNNGLIKIVAGLRRSGKSYLIFNIFKNYLLNNGYEPKNIICFSFDKEEDIEKLDSYFPKEKTKIYYKNKKLFLVNSKKFRAYIKDHLIEGEQNVLLLDEIQILEDFVFTLNSYVGKKNLDVYVTGSNSRMLSKDIITEFRDRGDFVNLYPLSFKEYFEESKKIFDEAYNEYSLYGGMPFCCNLKDENDKINYLKKLYKETYYKDIVDRNSISNLEEFDSLVNILSSSIGSYTNPTKLENTFKTKSNLVYKHQTIKKHIDFLEDAFLISSARRYDLKGKSYINSNLKYYFSDLGLRNAINNFRDIEPSHIMENIIYNELIKRGYSVDIGIIEKLEKNKNGTYIKKPLETDFVCNLGNEKIYIQSVYSIENKQKFEKEIQSFKLIKDNFKKIIITKDSIPSWVNEDGVLIISLKDFLLEKELF